MLGETNAITTTIPLSSSPSVFIAQHDVIWYKISLWSVGVSSPAVSPPTLLLTRSLLAGGGEREKRESLGSVQALFSKSQRIGALSTQF